MAKKGKKDCDEKAEAVAPGSFPDGALAIQMLVRELEVRSLSTYATDPRRFRLIVKKIGRLLDSMKPPPPPKRGAAICKWGCPPGWYCCCGQCWPQGRGCELCLGKKSIK